MSFYYFVTVSPLPKEVSYQDNLVELVEYKVSEGQPVERGTPLAIIKNRWAVFQVEAVGQGYCSKTFFKRGTFVKIGDPIAIIDADGEDMPNGKPTCKISIVEQIKQKPKRK